MDIATIVSNALLVLGVAEKMIEIGVDAAPNVTLAAEILQGKTTLSADQRMQLLADQKALEDKIDAAVAADDAAGV